MPVENTGDDAVRDAGTAKAHKLWNILNGRGNVNPP